MENIRRLFVVIVWIQLATSAAALAQCGGFCIYEVATPQMGSSYAGAGAAAQDAATAYLNPAGMTRLNGVNSLAGLVLSVVDSEFDIDTGKTTPAGQTNGGGQIGGFFPFGGGYVVAAAPAQWPGLKNVRLGFSFNNLYGGDLDYDNDWAGRGYVADIRFFGLNIEPALAYRVTDWLSLGAGLHILYYHLNYSSGILSDPSSPIIRVSGADDWTLGFTVAALLEPRADTRIGLVYRYKFDVDLHGEAKSSSLFPAPIEFRSRFTLPQGLNLSAFHDFTERWALLGDVGWTDWSQFNDQNATFEGLPTVAGTRNWHDTWRIGGGTQYKIAAPILAQAGFSYDSSPLPASNRLPDIPVGETFRFSLGAQWTFHPGFIAKTTTLGLAYTFLWVANADVDQVALPPTKSVVLDGKYDPDNANLIGLTVAAAF